MQMGERRTPNSLEYLEECSRQLTPRARTHLELAASFPQRGFEFLRSAAGCTCWDHAGPLQSGQAAVTTRGGGRAAHGLGEGARALGAVGSYPGRRAVEEARR